jgi:carboxyl-terminal processing protease
MFRPSAPLKFLLLALLLCPPHASPARLASLSAAALPEPADNPASQLSAADREAVFHRAWNEIRRHFYDPGYHGVDWNQIRLKYQPLVRAARSDDEFYSLLKQMTAELHDAHTRLSTPLEWRERERHEGVGMGFTLDQIDGRATVVSVLPNSSAAKAGVLPGMVLTRFNDHLFADLVAGAQSTLLHSSSGRADLLHVYHEILAGPERSAAAVVFQRPDGSTLDVTLTRQLYSTPPRIVTRILPSGVAYIRFDEFQPAIREEFKRALKSLRNAPAIILDLRQNGGGDLGTLLPIAGYFFPKRTLFARDTTRTGKPITFLGGLFKLDLQLYAGHDGGQLYSGPVAILVRARTASASEIFAAGMQETGRATIIGTQTCGCVVGIVKPHRLKGGSVLEIGEVLWMTPKGRKLEGEGVIPDTEIAPTLSDLAENRDPVLEQAELTLRASLRPRSLSAQSPLTFQR